MVTALILFVDLISAAVYLFPSKAQCVWKSRQRNVFFSHQIAPISICFAAVLAVWRASVADGKVFQIFVDETSTISQQVTT